MNLFFFIKKLAKSKILFNCSVGTHILYALRRRKIVCPWLWCSETWKFPCFSFFLTQKKQGNRCSPLHHCVFWKLAWPRAWQQILITCLLGFFFSNFHCLTVFGLYVPLHRVWTDEIMEPVYIFFSGFPPFFVFFLGLSASPKTLF